MNGVSTKKEQLDTPNLWVDLTKLERNILHLASHFKNAGVSWRPHIKGIKIPEIALKLIEAGAIGITCAKLSEAELMAEAGITDILIANQIVGEQKVTRLAQLCHHTNVKVTVDHSANVTELGQAASAIGSEVGVLVDVDTGMKRAGVQSSEEAVALAQQIAQTDGLKFLGVMAWEGHTIGLGMEEKKPAVEKAVGMLVETAVLCQQAGLPTPIVSAGGSGTYLMSPHVKGVTEIQAGGAIFNDVTYQYWGVQTEPCLFVQAQITSLPTPLRLITDAGFKALPSWAGQPQPIGINNVQKYRSSAEHGILELHEESSGLNLADRLDFIVGYTDATLFLHDKLYGVRDGVVEQVWQISGRGKLQ